MSDGVSSSGAKAVKKFASGTAVKIRSPGPVPAWVECDDDRGRTSGSVKRRMLQRFFRGDAKLRAEIAWITSESERDELSRKGRLKVKVKESSGINITFTAAAENLVKS